MLVDAHMHVARLPTLKVGLSRWVAGFGTDIAALYDEEGTPKPQAFSDLLDAEGVDFALLFSEYSPRVTGIQPIEDLLPLAKHDPGRVRLVANVNPHLHYPVAEEVERQLQLGAIALKLHPVHAGFPVNDRQLYPVYELCRDRGVPVIVHCGTSTFPGASNVYADPILLDDVLRDHPDLTVVLAHGGRGWWYDAAAFLALSRPNVWIDLAGLPPRRLPEYYARQDFGRLCRRFVFGTDWPAVPGIAGNARSVAALCPDDETRALVLGGNAVRVFSLPE
ncbi:MAG TPA: amidohydrolase family protein [Candidatus Limnocylindrales bacterium]